VISSTWVFAQERDTTRVIVKDTTVISVPTKVMVFYINKYFSWQTLQETLRIVKAKLDNRESKIVDLQELVSNKNEEIKEVHNQKGAVEIERDVVNKDLSEIKKENRRHVWQRNFSYLLNVGLLILMVAIAI
jgi:hypothetical protein